MSYNSFVETTLLKSVSKPAKKITAFLWQGLNQLIWPAICINCSQSISETENDLCKDCWDKLLACTAADYCPRCGRDVSRFAILQGICPNCQGEKINFDRIIRSGVYTGSLQEMILAFKKDRTEMDKILGFLANSALNGSSFINEIDFFVPVPLHFSRRLVRGYNQSLVIAKKLKLTAGKINTDLVRIRRTKAQPAMPSAAARAKNVAGAFAVRHRHNFTDRNICLVDDIKTTGATLNECARVLKQAGATKVFALALAVAGQNSK